MEDANVVCRQLGYPGAAELFRSARFGQGIDMIWLSGLECNGSELTLSECSHRGWGQHKCSHTEDASVLCGKCCLIVNIAQGEFLSSYVGPNN